MVKNEQLKKTNFFYKFPYVLQDSYTLPQKLTLVTTFAPHATGIVVVTHSLPRL